MDYEIKAFLPKVKAENYDSNADGFINTDNGELQNLLSGAQVDNVDELLIENAKKKDYIKAGITAVALTAPAVAGIALQKVKPLPFSRLREFVKYSVEKSGPGTPIKDVVQNLRKTHVADIRNGNKAILALSILSAVTLGSYFIFRKAE